MIKADALTKRYGGLTAIRGVSFEIAKSEVVGFLGPNGAGKTTTMRILTGYLPPSEGRAVVGGFVVDVVKAHFRRGGLELTGDHRREPAGVAELVVGAQCGG